MKKTIRLTESDLHRIIKQNVNKILKESYDDHTWVESNGKYNLIKPNGDLLSDQWFDDVGILKNGYAWAKLNGNLYYMNENKQYNNMSKKQLIRLTESELHNVIKESVNNILSELDWKTYANAARKRYNQWEKNPNNDTFKKAQKLTDKADRTFNDKYVGNWKHDALEDKLKGKKSATFDGFVEPAYGKNIAFGTLKGQNKGGSDIYSYAKNVYRNGKGSLVSPRQHFRDKEIADAYSRANDELWDYANGNYEYNDGEGWKLKESVDKIVNSILKEGFYDRGYNDHGDPVDEYAYTDSYEYIIDSMLNGNISQTRQLLANLDRGEIRELIEYTRNELGYDDIADKLESLTL